MTWQLTIAGTIPRLDNPHRTSDGRLSRLRPYALAFTARGRWCIRRIKANSRKGIDEAGDCPR